MAATRGLTVCTKALPMRGVADVIAVAVAVAVTALAASAYPASAHPDGIGGGGRLSLSNPSFSLVVQPRALVMHDTSPTRLLTRVRAINELWNGGPYTDAAGETFRIYQSSWYVDDPAIRQSWTGFFQRLPHGAELSRLTVYFSPLWEVRQICGAGALACYSGVAQAMVVPGDRGQVNMDQVIAHEYGHHIAANRRNDPWPALEYGTKRWATYANVCQRVQSGSASPGDEGVNYQVNPGEAFADTYRFMVGSRVSNSTTWNSPAAGPFLTPSFPNDSGAYAAVFADATAPWTGPTAGDWSGRLDRPKIKVRVKRTIRTKHGTKTVWRVVTRPKPGSSPLPASHSIDLPYDGVFTATLTNAPAGAALTVYDASGTSVIGPAGVASVSFTACGQRSVKLGLRAAAPGNFAVSLQTP
jgi:hypothetical protein